MPIFSATLGSFTSISFLSQSQPDPPPSFVNPFSFPRCPHKLTVKTTPWQWHHYHHHAPKIFVSGNTQIDQSPDTGILQRPSHPDPQDALRQARVLRNGQQLQLRPQHQGFWVSVTALLPQLQPHLPHLSAIFCNIKDCGITMRSSDWKAAKAYKDSGLIYNARVEGFNAGGLLLRFYSIMGFLPYPQLSPLHSSKEPGKTIQEIAKGLLGSIISVKVILADEDNRKLIFSEKEAAWSKYSKQVNIGDIFEAKVGSVEDYGAFVHLHFPDGLYHLTGLIHVSEVSWDLVQDVRDFLTEGDEVRVKVVSIDSEKSRIKLSIKQLEEDPLLETLEKVIPQDGSADPDSLSGSDSNSIEPLPGLETILEELLQEDGIYDARISRQGFEKRVVSQDLQLWLSNAPPTNQRFTLLARAGRQVQEIHLTTSLDQEGIKKALQRVLERVP